MFPSTQVLRFALDVTLKVTVLLLAALTVRVALRSASAALRHALTTLALGGALVLPLLSPWLPRLQVPLLANPFPKPRMAAQRVERVAPAERSVDAWPEEKVLSSRSAAAARASRFSAPVILPRPALASRPRIAPVPSSRRATWPRAAFALWAAGAAFALARLATGTARIRHIARHARPMFDLNWILAKDELARRLGLTRKVRIVQSDQVAVAMTYGVSPPLLLVSADADRWTPERRRLVLMHELAHVRRNDWIALLLAEVTRAVYWFHPLAWGAVELARRDCEKACDDLVLAFGTKPSVYAAHLLGIVRSLPPRPRLLPAVPMARPSQFEARMRAILDRRRPRRGLSAGEASLIAVGMFAAVVAAGAVQPWFDCSDQRAAFWKRASILRLPGLRKVLTLSTRDVETPPKRKLPRKPCEQNKGASPAIDRKDRTIERPMSRTAAVGEGVKRGVPSGIPDGIPGGIAGGVPGGISQGVAPGAAGGISGGIEGGVKGGVEGFEKTSHSEAKGSSHRNQATDVSREYAAMAAHPESRGEDFYKVGKRLLSVGSFDLAARAFHQSADAGYRVGTSRYNEACARALAGDRARAMELLEQALLAGFDDPSLMRKDSDFASLRSERSFVETLGLADDLALPGFSSGDAKARTSCWQKRAEHFAAFAQGHPEIGRAWFNLGFAKIQTHEVREATEAFERALALGYRTPTTMYNLACCFALRGERDRAFDWLFHALDEGFDGTGTLKRDSDLNSLHGDPRFRQALERAERDGPHGKKG